MRHRTQSVLHVLESHILLNLHKAQLYAKILTALAIQIEENKQTFIFYLNSTDIKIYLRLYFVFHFILVDTLDKTTSLLEYFSKKHIENGTTSRHTKSCRTAPFYRKNSDGTNSTTLLLRPRCPQMNLNLNDRWTWMMFACRTQSV